MFCEKCGAGLREGDRFCSQCGAPVKGGRPLSFVSRKEKEQGEPIFSQQWYEDPAEEEDQAYQGYEYGKAAAAAAQAYDTEPEEGAYLDADTEPEEEAYLDEDTEPKEEAYLDEEPEPEEDEYLDEEADQEDLLEAEPGRYLWREDWETDPQPGEGTADARLGSGRYSRERQRVRGGRPSQSGQVYYDENLYQEYKGKYRDRFLEKKEDKSHAMLTTVTILLVMAVLVAAFLILFFFMTRSHPQTPEGDPAGIEILSEETRTEDFPEIWDTERML